MEWEIGKIVFLLHTQGQLKEPYPNMYLYI